MDRGGLAKDNKRQRARERGVRFGCAITRLAGLRWKCMPLCLLTETFRNRIDRQLPGSKKRDARKSEWRDRKEHATRQWSTREIV